MIFDQTALAITGQSTNFYVKIFKGKSLFLTEFVLLAPHVNSVIHAYAQVGMPCKAEAVIRLMVQDFHSGNKLAEPNIRIFTNLLHAWRKSKDPEAPEKCEAILQEMQALSDSGRFPDCKPDTFAVTVSCICT
jgi:pentatricopeptide repeat protein